MEIFTISSGFSKKAASLRLAAFFVIFFLFTAGIYGATITSIASGNWSSSGTWDSGVPQAGDDVVIASGHTVTLDVSSAALNSLDVQGTLDVNGNLLDVNGDVSVSGTLEDLTYATNRVVTISGNLDVSGTLTYVSVKFDGVSQTVSGNGTIQYYYVEFGSSGTVSNTSASQEYYQIIVSAGTFQPSNNWNTQTVSATSFTKISITGGSFSAQTSSKFSFNATHTAPPPLYATITISNTSTTSSTVVFYDLDFQSDDANNSLQFYDDAGSTTYQINGTLNFTGTSKGSVTLTNSSLTYGTSGTLKYSVAGTVDQDEWPATGVPNVVLQSGAVTIPTGVTCEVDNKLTQINGSLTVSGTFGYDNTKVTTLEYAPSPAADVTVGDEWVTGATVRPSNVTVNNAGQTVTVSDTNRVIPKTLNIVAGTLAMGTNSLTVLGSIASSDIAGSGSITGSSINVGDGTAQNDQTISGSVTMDNLTVNKTGTTNNLTISGSPTITNDFTVTNGNVIADGTVTISSGALILSNSSTFTVRNGALSTATLTLNATSTFTTGGKTVSNLTTLTAASGSTFEFNGTSTETTPAGATFGNVNMNNTAGLNISGTVTVNGTLTFSQDATVNTDASNILIISTTGSISGDTAARYVKGPLRKQFSATGSFTFPVGSTARRSAVFEYTAGTFGGTSVIEIEHSTASFTEGTRPTGISAIDQSSHYVLIERGTAPTSFTYSFTGTFEDGNFSPETRNRILVQNSSTPTWTVGTTNPATDINTTDNTVKATGLSALPSVSPYLVAFGSATAAVTWDGGGGDSNWSTATNWVGDAVPQAGDEVLLDNSSLASNYTVIYDASVTQTSFSNIHIASDATHNITLTLQKATTVDLTATSDVLSVGSGDKLIYAGTTITMNGSAYDPSLTTYSGDVEYQTGSVYGDAYDGNLIINGATGTSGTTDVTVAGNLSKQSTTAFSSSLAFTVTGNYTNTAGNVTFSGGLTINGTTLTVSNGTINGTVTLSGTAAQTIEGSGTTISIENLSVDNANGVTLNNPVIIAGAFTFVNGLVKTTTTNVLTIGSAGSISGYSSARYVDGPLSHVGTGTKFYPVGDAGDYRPVTLANLTGTDPVIRFEMVSANPGGSVDATLDHISTIRYWQGVLTSGSITSCQVQLQWGENDGVDASPENLDDIAVATSGTVNGVYTSAGNAGTSGNNSSGTVISSSLNTMQYFTLGSINGDNSLPVELASFEASADFGRVTLNWTTASEVNNQGFNIYRKTNATQNWQQLNADIIAGQGNSSQESNYTFVDEHVNAGATYIYKLESVSLAGVRVEEKTVEVAIPVPTDYALLNNYPNPFNPTTHLRFRLPEAQRITLSIYDMRGQLVKHIIRNTEYPAGEYEQSWNATDMNGQRVSSGMYLYVFKAGAFQKVGKMILLK